MQELLDDLEGEAGEEFEDFLDDHDSDSARQLTIHQMRVAYDRFIRDWAAPSFSDDMSDINPKEYAVEHFTATVLIDKSRRLANIHIEDGDGKFVTSDLERHERALGAEMPIYLSMPQELYEAIKRA
jgi:hypothetical protein